jgi:predicted RNase H-like HicB family nuclease
MTKYEIILYWSVDDEAFIAEVPELAGCAADGPTRQEALANAETVIQGMDRNRSGVGTAYT